ncbi:unnamed protein product [Parajaminaea phylloscopi]
MNGIKKAFSHRRSSSDASSDADANVGGRSTAQTTPETSPKQAAGKKLVDEPVATRKDPVDVTKTGTGRSSEVAAVDNTVGHTRGHGSNIDPTKLTGKVDETTQHLGHIVDETKQHHTIEEVTRQRDLHQHHAHVQHHVVPIKDTEHKAEVLTSKSHGPTVIHEKHASTNKDAELLAAVSAKHGFKDTSRQAASTHQIVDRGEQVQESAHHTVHHVVQPVLIRDEHHHTRQQTTIPVEHHIYNAPIIHESIAHEPVSLAEFQKTGGVLDSKLGNLGSIKDNVLHTGKCERTVDGVGEKLAKELHLSPSTHDAKTTATAV